MSELKIGDFVEVREIVALGPDRWRPAKVIAVSTEAIGAELLAGDFGKPGENRIWLRRDMSGQSWRRATA